MPHDGADVYTTLDINLQNVAENSLHQQLIKFNAKEGCVIVMEVKTGYIKAIANLSKNKETNEYYEDFNLAIGAAMEPGSTMKLASVIVALEDGKVKPSTLINTDDGHYKYSKDFTMHDSRAHGTITFREAFELSSNIGISLPIYNAYKSKPSVFVDGLKRLGVHNPLGIAIQG
jgi:cell division protein FtsI (penicillin-binding protein 3)